MQAVPPAKRLTQVVSRSDGHHRDRQKADADHADGEQKFGRIARQRTQSLGRLGRRVDVVLPGFE